MRMCMPVLLVGGNNKNDFQSASCDSSRRRHRKRGVIQDQRSFYGARLESITKRGARRKRKLKADTIVRGPVFQNRRTPDRRPSENEARLQARESLLLYFPIPKHTGLREDCLIVSKSGEISSEGGRKSGVAHKPKGNERPED